MEIKEEEIENGRRIFTIDIGEISKEKIQEYIDRVKEKFLSEHI